MRVYISLIAVCLVLLLAVVTAGCAAQKAAMTPEVKPAAAQATPAPAPFAPDAWRGLHLYFTNRAELPLLHRTLKEALVPNGLNTLVLEVDYSFQYTSHPELSDPNGMTKEDARALAALCKELKVRLIPQFQCFGHQGNRPGPLLTTYPELMAPPKPNFNDPKHYQCSWNPLDPKTNEIAFALIDELIDAFQPDAFHVGLDEVTLFPDETTPYFKGESHAQIFAKAVNDLYGHVVKKRGLTMLMWGDRLLDKSKVGYNRMESSDNDTWPAIDMIPNDIIICDWHYYKMPEYRSVPFFAEKGFRVWPSSWRSPDAALAFIDYAQKRGGGKVIGHLCTSWCGLSNYCQAVLNENLENVNKSAIGAAKTFFAVSEVWSK